MPEARPSIPQRVKRQLRQEAGFGCCLCGYPYIQFHHIVPWAEDQHNRSEDMMVLCARCHHLATTGALTEADQRKFKDRPKNIVDGEVRGLLHVNQKELVVQVAGGTSIETPTLLEISGKSY